MRSPYRDGRGSRAAGVSLGDTAVSDVGVRARYKGARVKSPARGAVTLVNTENESSYKQIVPALQAMVKRGTLTVPVIAVTGESRDMQWWRERVHASLQRQGDVELGAFDKLMSLVRPVLLDFTDPQSVPALKRPLGGAEHPLYYLAIPPTAFVTPQTRCRTRVIAPLDPTNVVRGQCRSRRSSYASTRGGGPSFAPASTCRPGHRGNRRS